MINPRFEEAKVVVFEEASMLESVLQSRSFWEGPFVVEYSSYQRNMQGMTDSILQMQQGWYWAQRTIDPKEWNSFEHMQQSSNTIVTLGFSEKVWYVENNSSPNKKL